MRVQEVSDALMDKSRADEEEEAGEEEQGAAGSSSGMDSSSFNKPSHQLLSRRPAKDTRTLSVPNLLNLGSERGDDANKTSSEEANEDKQFLDRPLTQVLSVSELQHELAPQDIVTKNYLTNTQSCGADQAPPRDRQGSIDSLMRAAVTVEKNDQNFNKIYQNKISSIIELQNQISDEIKAWPTVRSASASAHEPFQSPTGPSYPRGEALLSQISQDNLKSLKNAAITLNATVRELDDLKNHQFLHGDPSKPKVTLPSINTLTSNITSEPPIGFQNYQFPNQNINPSIPQQMGRNAEPHFITSSSQTNFQPHSYVQLQGRPSVPYRGHPQGNYVSYAWPRAHPPLQVSHKATVSDPLTYQPNMLKESQNLKDANIQNFPANNFVSSPTSIVFQPPYSPAGPSSADRNFGKHKFRSKSLKTSMKSQRPVPENLLFESGRSLAHGLIMAETIRRNEQSTTCCVHCGEGSTPEWRRGPYGNRTLCNACGLFYRKLVKRFGSKDANMFMRYRQKVNPEDRRVPSFLEVPASICSELNNDKSLDDQYFNIGGSASNIFFTEKKR